MAVAPIKPSEVVDHKQRIMPDMVLQVFNTLIARNWDGFTSKILAKDAATEVAAALVSSEDYVYRMKYLDVEDIYRAAGWRVEYVKPDYTESFPSYFIFKKRD